MSPAPSETELLLALRNVIDPELGVNIVDLGLIYGVEAEGAVVRVRMTMTTPACPMGPYLTEEVERVITEWFPSVATVDIDLVFTPPWKPDRMTPDARAQLGWSAID